MIYADEVILSHTHENEYNSFVNNKKNEALKGRMILVKATDLQKRRGTSKSLEVPGHS
jgi:predicted Ser/Thr protein kinase